MYRGWGCVGVVRTKRVRYWWRGVRRSGRSGEGVGGCGRGR